MGWVRRLFRLALGRRLPTYDGDLEVTGCDGPVLIRRDRYAIPYVSAGTEEDAWFGLGFCQGQDRGGQLEILVRLVRGTLAEVLGGEGVAMDRLSRRVGFLRAARGQIGVAEPEVLAQLEAFARGVNAGMRQGGRRRAHELALLGCEPSSWTAADVQGYVVLLCFILASNWDLELVRLKILAEDGPEALVALDPAYPGHLPVTHPAGAPAGRAVNHLTADLEVLRGWLGQGASNAWAIAPERTATGRSILANDPHLAPMVPSLWYLANVCCPTLHVAGAAAVGAPLIAPGHNGHAAWGLTAAHADNTDLFLERVGEDGASVQCGEGWQRCEVAREVIRVKGGDTITEEVLLTPRGPIVSGGFDHAEPVAGANAISMSATWLMPRPYTGLFRSHHGRTFDDFRAAFSGGSTSTVSVVYADAAGHIGSFLGVEVPRRKRGHGLIPQPGWDEACGWERELVPFDSLPRDLDPESGFCATANNQPVPAGWDGPFLGLDWLDGYRQLELCAQLGQRHDWDLEATARLQLDVHSTPWKELRDSVLAVEPNDEDARLGRDILARWPGEMAADSVAATVFALFMAEVADRVIAMRAPRSREWALGRGFNQLLPHNLLLTRRLGYLVTLLGERPAGWFDDWERMVTEALGDAVRRLRDHAGNDRGQWHWGRVRPLTLMHFFSERRLLAAVFNVGPLPGSGDSSTVCQGAVDLRQPLDHQVSVPVLRTLFDVGNWENCRFALLGGQSGNPLSPHYADQIEPWQTAEGIPIAWDDAEVRRRTRKTLRLVPACG